MTTKRPQTDSLVEVIFNDGEVKTYVISAGPSIGGFLAREAGETGILNFFNAEESYAIPLANIREWKIVYRPDTERVNEPEGGEA